MRRRQVTGMAASVVALGEKPGGKLGSTGNDGDGVGLTMVGAGVGPLDSQVRVGDG